MEFYYLKVLFALLIVLGLIGCLAILMRKFNLPGLRVQKGKFSIEETFHLDPKRKIMRVKGLGKTYILLLGQSDILLDKIEEKEHEV